MTADGTEFRVNTQTNKVQEAAEVVALDGGGYVVVWQSNGGVDDSSDFGIRAQVFDDDGTPNGAEIAVNTLTASKQILPAVDAVSGGGFVVTWQSNDGEEDSSTYGIKAQVFGAGGTPMGGEFLVNTDTGGAQTDPNVVGLDGGRFLVSWKGDDGSGVGIKAQLYGPGGQPIGNEFQVNTAEYSSQDGVALSAMDGGGFVATWASRDRELDGSSWGVKAQIFDADGRPMGDEFLVNTTTTSSQQDADVTTLADGSFVVTWRSTDGQVDTSGTGIRAQVFNADGAKRGEELQVNSEFEGTQSEASVAALSAGGFVVTWRSADGVQDTESTGIKAQMFEADGTQKGGEFLLNQATEGTQSLPSIASLSNDRFVAVWETRDEDQGGISGRVFDANIPPEAQADSFTVAEDAELTGNVLENDSDKDGQSLTAELVSTAENGLVTLNSDGSFVYTPDANYNGIDQFVYAVDDGSGVKSSATVMITVDAVNDGPIAVNDTLRTNEDKSATGRVLTNDEDPDEDALSVSIVTGAQNGTVEMGADGRYTYTPDAGFFGSDSFTYQIDDGNGGTDTAAVSITVNEVNFGPVAEHDYFDAAQQETITGNVLFNDVDPDGDTLSVSLVYDVRGGTLNLTSDGGFVYTADAGFVGTDRFTYTVSDGRGGTDRGTVRIEVDPENFAPVAEHDYATVGMGQSYDGTVLDNDFDPDGEPLTVRLVDDVNYGALVLSSDGAFTYFAAEGYIGNDRFTYEIDDGNGGTDQANVLITVDGEIIDTGSGSSGGTSNDDAGGSTSDGGAASEGGASAGGGTGQSGHDTSPSDPGQTEETPTTNEDDTDGNGGSGNPAPDEVPEEVPVEEPEPELVQQVELIVNGGFEDNPLQKGKWKAFKGDEEGQIDAVPGWYVVKGHLELQNGAKGGTARGPDMKDTQLELDAHFNSTIAQDVQVDHAGTYTINLSASGRRNAFTSQFEISVSYTTAQGDDVTETHTVQELLAAQGIDFARFKPSEGNHALSFDVDIPTDVQLVTLSLAGTGKSDSYGAMIDDVSMMLTALPEDAHAILVPLATETAPAAASEMVFPDIPEEIEGKLSLAEAVNTLLGHEDLSISLSADGRLGVDVNSDGIEDMSARLIGFAKSFLEEKVKIGTAKDDILSGADGQHDMLLGGNGADQLNGLSGKDMLYGGDGADQMDGGRGRDQMDGGLGADRMSGGNGHDQMQGGDGADQMDGGRGRDQMDGGLGADRMSGGIGHDQMQGGAGADHMDGGRGRDKMEGGAGSDVMLGGRGRDQLYGDAGDDRLVAGAGRDVMTGGAGNDVFVLAQGFGKNNRVTDFTQGQDKLDLTALGVTGPTGWKSEIRDGDTVVWAAGAPRATLTLEDFEDRLSVEDFLF